VVAMAVAVAVVAVAVAVAVVAVAVAVVVVAVEVQVQVQVQVQRARACIRSSNNCSVLASLPNTRSNSKQRSPSLPPPAKGQRSRTLLGRLCASHSATSAAGPVSVGRNGRRRQ
jgi:hypothetical protein